MITNEYGKPRDFHVNDSPIYFEDTTPPEQRPDAYHQAAKMRGDVLLGTKPADTLIGHWDRVKHMAGRNAHLLRVDEKAHTWTVIDGIVRVHPDPGATGLFRLERDGKLLEKDGKPIDFHVNDSPIYVEDVSAMKPKDLAARAKKAGLVKLADSAIYDDLSGRTAMILTPNEKTNRYEFFEGTIRKESSRSSSLFLDGEGGRKEPFRADQDTIIYTSKPAKP